MNVFTAINDAILVVMDPLLNWLLALGRDAAIVIVAIGTALILIGVRKFTSNQDLLRRCRFDRRTLRRRIKEANCQGDGSAETALNSIRRTLDDAGLELPERDRQRIERIVRTAPARAERRRLHAVRQRISLKALAQEPLPLLASILPIALLATWAFARLGYVPPDSEQPVEIVAHFPLARAGEPVHLAPREGLTLEDGPVRIIEPVHADYGSWAEATWSVQAPARDEPYTLDIRFGEEAYRYELRVGGPTYTPPIQLQRPGSREHAVEARLEPARLFGVVPGLPWVGLAPWLVAYLLITIPFVPITKRLFRVY